MNFLMLLLTRRSRKNGWGGAISLNLLHSGESGRPYSRASEVRFRYKKNLQTLSGFTAIDREICLFRISSPRIRISQLQLFESSSLDYSPISHIIIPRPEDVGRRGRSSERFLSVFLLFCWVEERRVAGWRGRDRRRARERRGAMKRSGGAGGVGNGGAREFNAQASGSHSSQ